MDLNNLNINDFHIDATPRFNPPNQIMRDFRINALHTSTKGDIDLTEHGKALFQEYLTSSIVQIEMGVPEHTYCKWSLPEIQPRRKRAYCNTRIQRVQAKRKALDLDINGKCAPMRTRRASLAYRLAVEEWIVGKRSVMPRRAEFEHKPARVRRKEARRQMRWKPINLSDRDKEFIAQYGYDPLLNPFGVTEQDLGELNNVNRTYN